MRYTVWNKENLIELQELIAAGNSISKISHILGLSENAIRDKCKLLSLKEFRPIIHWTQKDIRLIKRLFYKGYKYKEIAIVVGKSYRNTKAKIERMGLKRRTSKLWTQKEIEQLIKLKLNGYSDKEIANFFKISVSRIECATYNYNIESIKRWDDNRDNIALINKINENKNVLQISLEMGKSPQCIYRNLKKLNLKLPKHLDREDRQNFRQSKIFICNDTNEKLLKEQIIMLYNATKYRAKSKTWEFDLTFETILNLYNRQNGLCFYSGQKMFIKDTAKGPRNPYHISIDRIDSSQGYTKNNIVLCCDIVNIMKLHLKLNNFYQWIDWIYSTKSLK